MNDRRYPNGDINPILGFRRSGFGIASDAIEALALEAFFESADPAYTPYVAPEVPTQVTDRLGDFGFPNQLGENITGFRRTRIRPDAPEGLDKIITRDLLGAQDLFGTATGAQPLQSGTGTGVLAFVGTGDGDQLVQTGNGTGAVAAGTPVAPPAPIVAEHFWGEWLNVHELVMSQPVLAPAPVTGNCQGGQSAQDGAGAGHVMPRIAGKSRGAQGRQGGTAEGGISMKAKNERELLELLLLDAA